MALCSETYVVVSKLLLNLTSLLLIYLAISAVQSKIYPRILGSSTGTTKIYSIDANLTADRLVAVGNTNDNLLIGHTVTSMVPFVAMYSIGTTGI